MLAINPQLRATNPQFSLDLIQTLEMPELLPPAVPVPGERALFVQFSTTINEEIHQ